MVRWIPSPVPDEPCRTQESSRERAVPTSHAPTTEAWMVRGIASPVPYQPCRARGAAGSVPCPALQTLPWGHAGVAARTPCPTFRALPARNARRWKVLFLRRAGSMRNRSSSTVWPNIASQVTPLARPANSVHSLAFFLGKPRSDHGNPPAAHLKAGVAPSLHAAMGHTNNAEASVRCAIADGSHDRFLTSDAVPRGATENAPCQRLGTCHQWMPFVDYQIASRWWVIRSHQDNRDRWSVCMIPPVHAVMSAPVWYTLSA